MRARLRVAFDPLIAPEGPGGPIKVLLQIREGETCGATGR